jgi:predicted transcriptional regulator
MTAKDTRLTFRVASDLKKQLESIAAAEGRSVAQICEAFLRGGVAGYDKAGTRYVRQFLARKESDS